MARHACESLAPEAIVEHLVKKLGSNKDEFGSDVVLYGRTLYMHAETVLDPVAPDKVSHRIELKLSSSQSSTFVGVLSKEGRFRSVLATGIHDVEVSSSDPQAFIDSMPFEIKFNALCNVVLSALDDLYNGDETVTLLSEDGDFKISTPYAESGPFRFDSDEFIKDGKLSKQAVAKLLFDGILTWRHHAQTHV